MEEVERSEEVIGRVDRRLGRERTEGPTWGDQRRGLGFIEVRREVRTEEGGGWARGGRGGQRKEGSSVRVSDGVLGERRETTGGEAGGAAAGEEAR